MKIKELIETNVVGDVKQDFNKGVGAVRKITAPLNKVFKIDQEPVAGNTSTLDIKDAVTAALQGKAYLDDVQTINKIIAGVKKGTYSSNDPATTIKALRTAANKQPLSQPYVDNLKQFLGQFD